MATDRGIPDEPQSPLFEAIFDVIKDWDIERKPGEGYASANGTDVKAIMAAVGRTRRVGDRQVKILLLEAPESLPLSQVLVRPDEAVLGSMVRLADADEAYVFRGDQAVPLKHRDYAPLEIHVEIQRRT